MSVAVGADIASLCSKCGDVWHVVVAKVGESIVKVQCKECGGYHRYRSPDGKSAAKRATSTTAKPRAPRAVVEKHAAPAVAADLSRPARAYKITETFEVPEVAALMAGATLEYHTCPRCRTRVGFDVTTCTACGHVWPADVPSSRLGQVTSRDVVDDIPMPASVMAVYSSDAMTVDVTITELRKDGLFIPTELLDAPGTPCEVTLLPDGQAPLAIQAEVTSVRGAVIGGAPPGLDVRFTRMSDGVGLWIELWLRAHQRRGTGG